MPCALEWPQLASLQLKLEHEMRVQLGGIDLRPTLFFANAVKTKPCFKLAMSDRQNQQRGEAPVKKLWQHVDTSAPAQPSATAVWNTCRRRALVR